MKSIDGILTSKPTPLTSSPRVRIAQIARNVSTDVFEERSVQIVRNQELLSHRHLQQQAEFDFKFDRIEEKLFKQGKIATLSMQLIAALIVGFLIAALGIM